MKSILSVFVFAFSSSVFAICPTFDNTYTCLVTEVDADLPNTSKESITIMTAEDANDYVYIINKEFYRADGKTYKVNMFSSKQATCDERGNLVIELQPAADTKYTFKYSKYYPGDSISIRLDRGPGSEPFRNVTMDCHADKP